MTTALCPGCGRWHVGPDSLSLCRTCWLGEDDATFKRALGKRRLAIKALSTPEPGATEP